MRLCNKLCFDQVFFIRLVGVLCLIIGLSACSGKKTYDLTRVQLAPDIHGNGKILLLNQDQRPFVLTGEKPAAYVGRQFNGYGIPSDVVTKSGKPVGEDFSYVFAGVLEAGGYEVETANVQSAADFNLQQTDYWGSDYDLIIAFLLKNWRTETYLETEFSYDIEVRLYDSKGELLVTKDFSAFNESDTLSTTGARVQAAVNKDISGIYYQILNNSEIKALLPNKPVTAAEALAKAEEAKNSGVNPDILLMEKHLDYGSSSFRDDAKKLSLERIADTEELDYLANMIWDAKESRDRDIVDGLNYLCRIFMENKNPRYSAFFDSLAKEAKSRKLRKYAIRTAAMLPDATTDQFDVMVSTR